MIIERFGCKIGLSNEMIASVKHYMMSSEYDERILLLFECDTELFHNKIQCLEDWPLAYLTYYILLSMKRMKRYREWQISKKIFWDTFSDIGVWARKYYKDTGKVGLAEYAWLEFHLRLELFTLGRLQFRMVRKPLPVIEEYMKKKPFTLNLDLHIAATGKLSYNEVERSYKEAHEFFRNRRIVFSCHSWLLAPGLRDILLPESNILKLQEDYQLLNFDYNSRQAEDRIFGFVTDNSQEYPENTSLQRGAKKLLGNNDKIPETTGVYHSVI